MPDVLVLLHRLRSAVARPQSVHRTLGEAAGCTKASDLVRSGYVDTPSWQPAVEAFTRLGRWRTRLCEATSVDRCALSHDDASRDANVTFRSSKEHAAFASRCKQPREMTFTADASPPCVHGRPTCRMTSPTVCGAAFRRGHERPVIRRFPIRPRRHLYCSVLLVALRRPEGGFDEEGAGGPQTLVRVGRS